MVRASGTDCLLNDFRIEFLSNSSWIEKASSLFKIEALSEGFYAYVLRLRLILVIGRADKRTKRAEQLIFQAGFEKLTSFKTIFKVDLFMDTNHDQILSRLSF